MSILLYHFRRFFGITFISHPHSGWLFVSHFALKCLKALTQKVVNFTPGDHTSYYLFDVFSHSGTYTYAVKEEKDDVITSFAGSADFTAARKARIMLDYTHTPNTEGDTFVPYTKVNDAK